MNASILILFDEPISVNHELFKLVYVQYWTPYLNYRLSTSLNLPEIIFIFFY